MAAGVNRISSALGIAEEQLAPLAKLSEDQLAVLADVIDTAITQQEAEIQESMQHVLRLAPGPFKGPVRKLLFPGGN